MLMQNCKARKEWGYS